MTAEPVLRPGDRVRVHVDFLGEVQARPTLVLEVVNIVTAPDGSKVLAVRPPAPPA